MLVYNDLFFILTDIDICNYADDTTPFVCGQNLSHVLSTLESKSGLALQWFHDNYMKMNPDKCHLLTSGYKHEFMYAKLCENLIWESSSVKLLGVTIDSNLKFDSYILKICSIANRKLSALFRLSSILTFEK